MSIINFFSKVLEMLVTKGRFMCDTMLIIKPSEMYFAKNSDREVDEAQIMEWHARQTYAAGAVLKCTWIEIPQVPQTQAVMISRPWWMWGAEMGTNEHGVMIGNEAVFTKKKPAKLGLTGMDLLRLALERAKTAAEALAIILDLIKEFGQGGSCAYGKPGFRYCSSFFIADGKEAFHLETTPDSSHHEKLSLGVHTISNFFKFDQLKDVSNGLYTWIGAGKTRQARSQRLCQSIDLNGDQESTLSELMKVLRDHGEGDLKAPPRKLINGGMSGVCMHGGGLLVANQTTASWVARLSNNNKETNAHWVTGTASPCVSLFKPVRVTTYPLAKNSRDLWREHEAFKKGAEKAGEGQLVVGFCRKRDQLEAQWLSSPTAKVESSEAFAAHFRLIDSLMDLKKSNEGIE